MKLFKEICYSEYEEYNNNDNNFLEFNKKEFERIEKNIIKSELSYLAYVGNDGSSPKFPDGYDSDSFFEGCNYIIIGRKNTKKDDTINIYKIPDEYFLVTINMDIFFKCDQISGLEQCLYFIF